MVKKKKKLITQTQVQFHFKYLGVVYSDAATGIRDKSPTCE